MKVIVKHAVGLALLAGCSTYFIGRTFGSQSEQSAILLARFFVEIFFSGAALLGGSGIVASSSLLLRRLKDGDDLNGPHVRHALVSLLGSSFELLVSVTILVLGGYIKSDLISAVRSA